MKDMKKNLAELFHWFSLQEQMLRFYKVAVEAFWHHGNLLIVVWNYSLGVSRSNLTSSKVNRKAVGWGPRTGPCDWAVLLGVSYRKNQKTFNEGNSLVFVAESGFWLRDSNTQTFIYHVLKTAHIYDFTIIIENVLMYWKWTGKGLFSSVSSQQVQ